VYIDELMLFSTDDKYRQEGPSRRNRQEGPSRMAVKKSPSRMPVKKARMTV
jgi:hypothetical protein